MRSLASILLPVLLTTAGIAVETRVRVTIDHTSLRYQNADSMEVACVVSVGQELVVRGPLEGNWVPVIPPDDVSVWIYAELVHKGLVVRDKAQVRCGPGLTYKIAGSLDLGTAVETRGRTGDWIKIRPLSGFSLWVSRLAIVASPTSGPPDSIPLPPTVATGLLSALTDDTNDTVTTTGTVIAVTAPLQILPEAQTGTVVRSTLPPELAALALTASSRQGCRIRCTGTLRASGPGFTFAPVHYRLSGPDRSGGIVTFCHVLAPDSFAQLNAIPLGTQVTLEGPAWMLRGESVPVLKVEKIVIER